MLDPMIARLWIGTVLAAMPAVLALSWGDPSATGRGWSAR